MSITLYTLPHCGICNMVKTKLHQKNIEFKEKSFEEIAATIDTNLAPVLQVENDIYNSPTAIVKWINEQ